MSELKTGCPNLRQGVRTKGRVSKLETIPTYITLLTSLLSKPESGRTDEARASDDVDSGTISLDHR